MFYDIYQVELAVVGSFTPRRSTNYKCSCKHFCNIFNMYKTNKKQTLIYKEIYIQNVSVSVKIPLLLYDSSAVSVWKKAKEKSGLVRHITEHVSDHLPSAERKLSCSSKMIWLKPCCIYRKIVWQEQVLATTNTKILCSFKCGIIRTLMDVIRNTRAYLDISCKNGCCEKVRSLPFSR